ncbi:MAG: hypothetical protein QW561_01750 [Candidatus Aenigmatarchaeota archaeon]
MKKLSLPLLLSILLISCGGGLTSAISNSEGITETVTMDSTEIKSNSIDSVDRVSVTFGCEIKDLFSDKCNFDSVEVNYPTLDYSYSIPLGISLKNKEQKTIDIKIADESVKLYGPFAYLRDTNPSTSSTEWTVVTKVLARPQTQYLTSGYEVCHEEQQPPANPEDPPPPPKMVCVPGEDFTAYLSGDYTPGTLAIYGGSGKLLEETSFGLLTGQGSGSITKTAGGYSLNFHITGGVPKGASIIASYLTPFEKVIVKGNFAIQYGDLNLTMDKGVLKDSSNRVYGLYKPDGSIEWIQSLGNRPSAVVAMYETDPWVGHGGEIVGAGDGFSSVYEVQTKYPYIKDDTLRVFSDVGPGNILFYDKYTGKITVKFDAALPKGTKIKASYVVYRVSVPVELTFKTSSGEQKKEVKYTLEIL